MVAESAIQTTRKKETRADLVDHPYSLGNFEGKESDDIPTPKERVNRDDDNHKRRVQCLDSERSD